MKTSKNPFSNINRRYRALIKELPAIASEIAVNDFKERFRKGGITTNNGFEAWEPRQAGAKRNSRGILVDSGRLWRSITAAPHGNTAGAVSNVPYAAPLNEGLEMRGNKRVQVGTTRSGRPKFKRTSEKAKMPKREFMSTTDKLLDEMEQAFFDEIDILWNS
jgi:phage gpG-like protein